MGHMNIAIFTDTYPPEINGVATSSANLRATLLEHGHNVLVVTTNVFGKEIVYEDGVLRIPGVEMKQLYGYRLTRFYSPKAMRYVVEFAPDIVHIQTGLGVGTFGQVVAYRCHIGSIYTFHTMYEDYTYYVTKGHFERFARHSVREYFRRRTSLYDELIAPSDKIKDYLRSIGIDSTVTIMPTGIDFSRFDPSKEDKKKTEELRKKFGIKPTDTVILSLGRIAHEKSIDVLLKGYAAYLKKGEDRPTKFVITGLGPAVDSLKELSRDLGIADHVVFTGPCKPDETQDYYRLGQFFASASLTETQGLTFMEAMAARLIVFARYDDNLVGTIKDGETGFFFFNEQDFEAKLRSTLNIDPKERKRIEENALEVIDVYSLERFYKNAMEVYNRVRKRKW